MNLDKKKMIFASLVLVTLLFLVSYTYIVVFDEEETPNLTQPDLPEWEATDIEYQNKKQALDALKEERETLPPSLYEDHMIDDKGYFNPDYMEFEKHRIIDSIYQSKTFQRSEPLNFKAKIPEIEPNPKAVEEEVLIKNPLEFSLNHQLFFATNPKWRIKNIPKIKVKASGNQVLKNGHRLKLQLVEDIQVNNQLILKNTVVWGIVSFKPNRVLLDITQIGGQEIALEAADFQDGLQGIYIKNSLKSEVKNQVLSDAVQDINIAGVPQLRGLKNIFQRHQRNLKITVLDGYLLQLQSKTP